MKNLVVLFSLVFFFGCKENAETSYETEAVAYDLKSPPKRLLDLPANQGTILLSSPLPQPFATLDETI